ncbi:FtsW/RodA/SpoVE family cell cycle protein [Psychroserpens sp.]|uniref:FtsW/RodA/SpoVE family cell cycle protein n=1 Tax=Psychroserpens sp. TaxID=2020870 RepID=UPI001B0747F3|nr:FtsW/RodA/SpoVE family cell cycle protein [Psychroserpens sp.]MBO6605859.1 FtsW/RodA/SpoVE family cell cycle protein [Psychroserpens sp.]MBO6652770.1 FtsW/RodA/SpoVE family cell cycle protein [Psychroserpens sp.]MBO6681458.1 FtsW/RodA/SpoVE family cell cycle protein [Psychroserpens sp.]MBO6749233.1 FtsW/RodA/SpoVE family cell cycle protein [Psychroserpens sp.]MBO6914321.1 FtsW/RodA/SpoVE family cell cycle protein [Psychroserpens sp.]
MQTFFKNIKGDRLIWAIAALLAIFSFLPVYSAASNLAYVSGVGNTFSYFVKHFMHLFLGFAIMYGVHKIPYRYFRGLSMVMIPIVLVLLVITMFQGTTIEGANASRWIQIPFVGMSFQTSTLASVVLMVYVARYLSKIHNKQVTFLETILPLWVPVFFVLILILPANFSTTAIIFLMVMMLSFIGGYPVKYLAVIIGVGIVALTLFVLVAKAFPEAMPNRVDTWMSRVENFSNGADTEADYQIEKAKIAIASGDIFGRGPGKSQQKNFLPQSSSDFIFAIIIEEYGLVGGLFLLVLYSWLLFRIVIVSQKSDTIFGKLLVLGVGLPIIFQALINMAVAVELFPVTGQTLPLISSGGTSIWMTCLAIGIILSVSARREQLKQQDINDDNPLEILSETI